MNGSTSSQYISSREHSGYIFGKCDKTIFNTDQTHRVQKGPRRRKWWLKCCKPWRRWASLWNRQQSTWSARIRKGTRNLWSICIRECRQQVEEFATRLLNFTSTDFNSKSLLNSCICTFLEGVQSVRVKYSMFCFVILFVSFLLLYDIESCCSCAIIVCAYRNKQIRTMFEAIQKFVI